MFLDIGVGILASIITSELFSITLDARLVVIGVAFALLPDIDFTVHLMRIGNTQVHRHRDLIHFPLLYIPIGAVIVLWFGTHWMFLFALASLLHFIHDSIGVGWGVQWLYPFVTEHYSFLYLYKPRDKLPLPRKWIYTWKHDDIDRLNREHGDENWMKNIYLRAHPYAVVEFIVFFISLAILYFWI